MKRLFSLFTILVITINLWGCATPQKSPLIAATTLPVYEFAKDLCAGTGITVTQVVTEEVSCLHDYTLQVRQLKVLEQADWIIISGAGLEGFLDDALYGRDNIIDASAGIYVHCSEEATDHKHDRHHHETDPHYWLSPANARTMSENILMDLCQRYPQHINTFNQNFKELMLKFYELDAHGQELSTLSARELITFHDGFAYLAEAYDLHIIKAIEEESGSEASASELIELCNLVQIHHLPAVFTEKNGSVSAAMILAAETGVQIYQLDMAVSGESYFSAMHHNIDTLKEALG